MTARKKKWLIGIAVVSLIGITAVLIAARQLANQVEPYIHDQAVQFLEKRFDSEVTIGALRVKIRKISPWQLLAKDLHGATARVEGERVILRHKGRTDIPPMFVMKRFTFDIDLRVLLDSPRRVPLVTIDGMEITIPPKGERPNFQTASNNENDASATPDTGVIFDQVVIKDSRLTILPRDRQKTVLQFALHDIRMQSAGKNVALRYHAALSNPRPRGEIVSSGTFGPWVAGEPGDSSLTGDYRFDDANLGVFGGIAGILDSTGRFEGTLNSITARGQATVPDFRLKRAGNIVPLKAEFEVLVDGTNGNTVLKPVVGTLGTTTFKTSGGVIKHESDLRRTVSLNVDMPKGNLTDLLTLAMKGNPFMEGQIALKTKIDIPPLSGKVREKLLLDGEFDITHGKFLRSTIQDQIDMLSRRGQGQPKNMAIDEVVLAMGGRFKMEDETISFKSLSFAVPGSGVDLSGDYDMDKDRLDFHGTLKLDAKVSETMTGWKRWVLKPVDPFFAKNGAGTFLRIQVVGSAKAPKFGRDQGPQDKK